MSTTITLEDIRNAWASQDPELPRMIVDLASANEYHRHQRKKDGAFTFADYSRTIRAWNFKYKPLEERVHFRVERMKELEAQDPEIPLPDRIKLWSIIEELWQAGGPYERNCLLEVIAKVPFRWGAWRAIKRIFKQAEERADTEIFGAIAARVDQAYYNHRDGEIRRRTLSYMRRRAWRFLRRQAETLPAVYVDAAVDILRFYTIGSNYHWKSTWIANHIWYHDLERSYGRGNFRLPWREPSPIKHRAYAELWRRTPRPLFTLLERACSEKVRAFAVEALKTDFRASLREVEPAWVQRLISVSSESIHNFVVWLLKNVPRFEQGAFRELGLHEPVLGLLNSPSSEACSYAASYARTHARDLPLDQLIRLIDNPNAEVRKLAVDLIQDRDPRNDIGLEAWGQMLESQHGHELAASVLRKHFGTRELSPEWFRERLLSDNNKVFKFATDLLPKVHSFDSLGSSFFQGLLDDKRIDSGFKWNVISYVFETLEKFPADQLDLEFFKRALLRGQMSPTVRTWIQNGRLDASRFGIGFFKSLAHWPQWDSDAWVKELKSNGPSWAENLNFDAGLSSFAFEILGDGRTFKAKDIGFDWLMELAGSVEEHIHNFAVETMIRAFKPADFDDQNSVEGGCQTLWDMATDGEEETPRSRFALGYLRNHHPQLTASLRGKDEAFTGDALIPESFFSFERVRPLFTDHRRRLRAFGIELAHWDFARWQPDMSVLCKLCESSFGEVFQFISKALLAEDKEEHKCFRLDPDSLSPESVYRFCESLDKPTRDLGMKLIQRDSRLADPTELFRLSESPDRQVQAFVIRTIWSLYRAKGITSHWTPPPPAPKKGAKAEASESSTGSSAESRALAQKPENNPASPEALRSFLRQILFTVAPARLPKASRSKLQEGSRLKPLPARKAKLALIEVMRDLSLEDRGFAAFVQPLLKEFMGSRGKSEQAACLVALTRIQKAHGSLETQEVS